MSQQQDLHALLAALTAQQSAGNMAQGQQAAYVVPQPTNSGSLDLTNIKPTNTGVVFTDALARARGIARGISAQKGRAPTDDGRYSTRSRSRSPQRMGARDNYRDNYNPYRDERREDPRRANGPTASRERSFSPNLPARPVTSYPPAGDGSETISIDHTLVGLIIGRNGENLRRVEAETSTRVQFLTTGPDASGTKRQCKITGSRQAREDAKAEIARIIEENGNPARGNVPPDRLGVKTVGAHQPALRAGEASTQIMVPNRTVGLIIGRGGETIRDLQERSQCHVNIVGEEKSQNGLRPVNLIGTPEAAAMAKDLIMEIVDSDTKSLAAQGAGTSRGNGRGAGGAMHGGFSGDGSTDDRITDKMMVPSDAVGMIIGKGGETIKEMQSSTGCKINVSQPSGQDIERQIGLVGTREAIEQAKHAIMEKVQAVEEKNRGGSRRDDYQQSDRYSQQPSYSQQQQVSYTQPAQVQQPAASDSADPYAPYGGYQKYVALWYSAMQGQQGQQPPGQGQGPPGPA